MTENNPEMNEEETPKPRKTKLVELRNHRVMVSRNAVFLFLGAILTIGFLAYALPQWSKEKHLTDLMQSLSSDDSDTRQKAFDQLSQVDDDLAPWFKIALKDAPESQRARLIAASAALGATKHTIVPLLLESYRSDPSEAVKRAAALGLCRNAQGRSELSPVFIELAEGSSVVTRSAGLQALIDCGDPRPEILSRLKTLFSDPNKDIQRRAAKTFLDLAPKDHPDRPQAKKITEN